MRQPARKWVRSGALWGMLGLALFESGLLRTGAIRRWLPPLHAPQMSGQVPVYCKVEGLRRRRPGPSRLVVGTSRAHYALNPAVLDADSAHTTFNGAVFCAMAELTWVFLQTVEPYLEAVDTLIYEVAPFALNSHPDNVVRAWQQPGLDLLEGRWESLPRTSAMQRAVYAVHPTYWWRVPLRAGFAGRLDRRGESPTALWMYPFHAPGPPGRTALADWDGWRCLHTEVDPAAIAAPQMDQMNQAGAFTLTGDQAVYFERTLRWAAARDIAVLVVTLPVPRARAEAWRTRQGAAYAAYREYVAATCARTGATFLDLFPESFTLPATYFADFTHVNCIGATHVSLLVARALDDRQ